MQDSWASNFWNFAKDVPEKPANSRAQRSDPTKPWGVNNFYWKETRSASQDRKQYMKEWHKHARAANPEYYADRYLKKRYGVTFEWYSKKLSEQNNVCAICKQSEKSVIKGKVISMPVDHCHKTGNARGLICTKCNRGLGLFCDDVSILESAIKYLKS